MIEVKDVSKTFGSLKVLRRLSLSFQPGEVVLLVGANGAGKSTLLKIIAGLSRADSGEVVSKASKVSFLSHHLFLYGRLSVRENLQLFGAVQGVRAIDDIIRSMELSEVVNRPVSELSKGNQAKVGIARALVGAPEVLLLDEPTSNLDEKGTALLLSALSKLHDDTSGRAVTLIATHDLHRLAPIATRVIVLSGGEVISDSGPRASKDTVAQAIERYREVNR